jgi:predicted house-cleaning noncanonical NTP pyrophosphatase (MazG superfamily)
MRKFIQNKLWRDKAPELMEQMGSIIHCKNLNDAEYDQELQKKLIEEIQEVVASKNQNELTEELADIFEVIDALCILHAIKKSEIFAMQEKKRQARGGFFERKFVTIAEHPEGSFGERYCLAQPEKYPEVKE